MQLVLPVKKGKAPTELSSGHPGFSPDGKTFLAICENTPQIHFGSQCATEDVYRHLPAKVELKKSHFGKTPLTECALCHLPCQSELAELRERDKKAQSRTRPCAILQISVYKKQSNLMLWNKNKPMSRFRSVRFAPNYLGYIFL